MLKKPYWYLFALVLGIELAIGYYVSVTLQYINVDAISRVANAFFVLFSRDPHFAAVGFVWNPLPSILTLPILLFDPLYKPLSSAGLSGVVLTALFAAFTALLLLKTFRRAQGKYTVSGVVCTLLFVSNPFVLWYGANGMSEAVFGFFIMLTVFFWTQWSKNPGVGFIVSISLFFCLAFLIRYEAIPFCAAVVFATFIYQITQRTSAAKMESSIFVLLTPVLCTVGFWIFLNYSIMGDPLFFLNSSYSNAGQSQYLQDNASMSAIIGSPALSLFFVIERTAVFALPYIAVLIARLVSGKTLQKDFIALTMFVFSIPVFQWFMLNSGLSFGWLRFFYYPLLITVAWLPYEFSSGIHSPRIGKALKVGVATALLASAVAVVPVMNNARMSPEEYAVIHHDDSSTFRQSRLSREIARLVDEAVFAGNPNALVIADAFNASEVILNSGYPKQYVNTSDRDFRKILENPAMYDTIYILAPDPIGLAELNAVNVQYPLLFHGGYGWAEQVLNVEDKWRLFKVLDTFHA